MTARRERPLVHDDAPDGDAPGAGAGCQARAGGAAAERSTAPVR